MFKFPVVPISSNQLLDVRDSDLVKDGLYRKCDTYRGGGGYDQFPIIANKQLGKPYHHQLVVQLQKCNLDCPYCYVTRQGVWGEPVLKNGEEIVQDFLSSGQQTLHLMGGAPALYIEHWSEIINVLPKEYIFHSDLMLTEKIYKRNILNQISQSHCLYAVNIKGTTPKEWEENTRKPLNVELFWNNLQAIFDCNVPCYFTFTACSCIQGWFDEVETILGTDVVEWVKRDWYNIDLINYDALPYVDSQEWGVQNYIHK